jgi:hypothetical protein
MAENEKSKTAQLPMMQQQQRLPATSSSSTTTSTSSPSNGSEHDQGYSGDYYSSWSEGSHCGSSSSCSNNNGTSNKNEEHNDECGPVVSRRSSCGNGHSRYIRKSDTHHPTNERSRTTCSVSGTTSSTQYGNSIDLALVQAVSASASAAAASSAESSWPPPRANTNTLITTTTATPVEAAYHGLMEVSACSSSSTPSHGFTPQTTHILFFLSSLWHFALWASLLPRFCSARRFDPFFNNPQSPPLPPPLQPPLPLRVQMVHRCGPLICRRRRCCRRHLGHAQWVAAAVL